MHNSEGQLRTFNPTYTTPDPQCPTRSIFSLGADSIPPTRFEQIRAKAMNPAPGNPHPLVGPCGFTPPVPCDGA